MDTQIMTPCDCNFAETGEPLADFPFRATIYVIVGGSPEEWCAEQNLPHEIQLPAADLIYDPFRTTEFRFATEQALREFCSRFSIGMAWIETAEGRHLPLAWHPPDEHRPDIMKRGKRTPPRKADAGWDPNRSLTWKQRERMATQARDRIDYMLGLSYRSSPSYTFVKISGIKEGPMFFLDFMGHRFVIFVQVMFPTVEPDWRTVPGILAEAAARDQAQPAVVFVDPDRDYRGAGFIALAKRLKNLPEWRKFLLYGRTPGDFLKMRGARISQVEFRAKVTDYDDFWHRPMRMVEAEMLVDGEQIKWLSLSTGNLLHSLAYPDQLELFTCDCGDSGCAGIRFGCITCEHEGIMLIKMYSGKRPRLLLFDADQYRNSALDCLGRLSEMGLKIGTHTSWVLVRPDSLKKQAKELGIRLSHEN
jgi:hypothetical protein